MKRVDIQRQVALAMVERFFINKCQIEELVKTLRHVEGLALAGNSVILQRIKVRIRKIEIDNRAVGRVINRLDENRKTFVFMKWGKVLSELRISVELGVSKMTLYRWKDDFLDKVIEEGFLCEDIEVLFRRLYDIPLIIREYDEDIAFLRQFSFMDFENDLPRIERQRNCLERFKNIVDRELELMTKEKHKVILREKFWRQGEITDDVIVSTVFKNEISRSIVTMVIRRFVERVNSVYWNEVCELAR